MPKIRENDGGPFAGMMAEERDRHILELLAFAAQLKFPSGFEAEVAPVVIDNGPNACRGGGIGGPECDLTALAAVAPCCRDSAK